MANEKPKNPFRMTAELSTEKGGITFQVIQRSTDTSPEAVTEEGFFGAQEIAESLRLQVALYGYSKLLQDRTSEVPAGPGKLAEMKKVAALLAAGVWEKERVVGAPVVSAEVEALAAIYGKTIPEIQSALKGYSKEQKDQILSSPKVVAKAAELRAARESAPTAELDLSLLS